MFCVFKVKCKNVLGNNFKKLGNINILLKCCGFKVFFNFFKYVWFLKIGIVDLKLVMVIFVIE